VSDESIAGNLRRLRAARHWTQETTAEAAGLSRVGYRNLEAGTSVPRVETLRALAQALEVPIQDLVTPVPTLHRVRFRSLKRLNSRDQVLATVARQLSDFAELEGLLGEHLSIELPHPRRRPASGDGEERARMAASAVRRAFDLDDEDSIRDISGLLESNGIKVLPVQVASDAFFGLSVGAEDGGPAIVVNTWERISVERWIFTAAHELGHLVLHLADYDVTQTQEEPQQELEANLFAAYFLMPNETFQREWEKAYGLPFVERVLKVKRMFSVSYRTVLYRLAQTSDEGAGIWRRFQIEWKRRHGRSLLKEDEPEALGADAFAAGLRADEPERLSVMDFTESRLRRLVRNAIERGEITLSRGAEILGLSLSQMREQSAGWIG
jgi:Zn-dependent peptidase ImmA (M78 family)/DNA-binding XRE family transcriptional regulator